MRFAPIGLIALTVAVGCARWGYHALPSPDGHDAGMRPGKDAAAPDAARPMDASKPDATDPDGSDQDSSIRDAGSMDSGPAPVDSGGADDDAGAMPIDAGANDLCPKRADALFCDGFDDPMLKNWPIKLQSNGAGMHSPMNPKYSGEGVLRATTGAAGATNYVRYGANVFDHQKSGDIWLRYFYYIPSSTMITASFSSAAIGELESPNFSVYLLIRPDGVDVSTGSAFYRSATVFPRDEWVCVELHVQIDDTAGAYEAYLDGTRIVRTGMPTDTLPSNGYTGFDVGIHATASTQGPVEVFVDDVVAGPVQVGCN